LKDPSNPSSLLYLLSESGTKKSIISDISVKKQKIKLEKVEEESNSSSSNSTSSDEDSLKDKDLGNSNKPSFSKEKKHKLSQAQDAYLTIHKDSDNISRLKHNLGIAKRLNSNFKKDSVAMDNKTNFT
jgi:hypothetical protein